MKVVVDWTGDVICTLVRIVSMWRHKRDCVHELGRPEDDAGLAGDDSATLSRTIRWTDGRNEILLWKLPSTGP
jgi:hypothetical protein